MAIILLKNMTDKINIIEQQNAILSYARKNHISIDAIEIETSDASNRLEDRDELKGFLRSLNQNDTLLIYDFWILSSRIGEIVKLLECALGRNITVHVIHKKEIIESNMGAYAILNILAKERANKFAPKENIKQGRPKGRMSQSKFDQYRSNIITCLEKGYSVSKIAQELNISRTSLKDYINSRNLKGLVQVKKDLLGSQNVKTPKRNRHKIEKCDLIAEENQH